MSYPEYYHERADAEELLAQQSALPNVRASHHRAAEVWRQMARRAERAERMKAERGSDEAINEVDRA